MADARSIATCGVDLIFYIMFLAVFRTERVKRMAQQNLTDDKPLIDRVYDFLAGKKQAMNFYDLANGVIPSDIEGEERIDVLARLYTTMNIDGRFLAVGQNFWGLKDWYPVEQQDEDVASHLTTKRKRRALDDDYDDFDDLDEDLIDDYDVIDEDLVDDYDDIDEEHELDDYDDEDLLGDDNFDDTDDDTDVDEELEIDEDDDEELS